MAQSDGVKSSVNKFTTPGPGERIVTYPAKTKTSLPPK